LCSQWREFFENLNKSKQENVLLRKELDDLEEKYENALQKKMVLN